MNREVIARQLRLLSYASDFASDGRHALELWRLNSYAALLCDLRMPEMDGYALTAAIRAEEFSGKRLPIIALTANALPEEAKHCRAAGMDDYLTKPLLLEDLGKALEKWVPLDTGAPVRASAPVDLAVLKSIIGDDEDATALLLKTYSVESRKLRIELERCAKSSDGAGAVSAAHRFKSNANAIGATVLGGLCELIEHREKTPGAAGLHDLVRTLEIEAAVVDDYLESLSRQRARVATS